MRNVFLIAMIAAAAACGHKAGNTGGTSAGSASPMADKVKYSAKDLPPGLALRLSNGKQGVPAFDHSKLAPATKLADAEVQALLSRSKPITTDPADQTTFALRPGSQPPPRTGETIKDSFPPPPSTLLPPKANDAGKDLTVLRYMPEGEVKLAPQLSITFSQPMVAVTSQEDAAATQPVKLTPTPKGKWRWIGTRTILFDPDPRFPQATTYQVEVPAGTKSANGGVLQKAVKFSFETPAPTMISSYPGSYEPQHLDVPMFVMFDQKIDPAAVLKAIKTTVHTNGKATGNVWWGNGTTTSAPLHLLGAAEIEKDKTLKAFAASAKQAEQEGRWFAFRFDKDLPPDAQIEIDLPPGIPSAEGPNRSKQQQSFSFHTYPPFQIVRADCGYGDVCRPGMPLSVIFNNPIDDEKFDDSLVTVTPEIPGMHVIGNGQSVSIVGATKSHVTYKVTVSGKIVDDFGQHLGKDATETFTVGDAYPTFYGPSGMVVLDPMAAKPTLDFFTTNYEQLKVRIYQVDTTDLVAYGTYLANQWNHDHPPPPPGHIVFDHLVKTPLTKNELVETSVDLMPAMNKSGYGNAVVIVEPYPWHEKYPPPRMVAWIQSTKLAVDAHVDNDNLIAFASELGTGKPLANVAVEIRPYGIKGKTDERGIATLPLGTTATKGPTVLVAQRGDDIAFVTGRNNYYDADYGDWRKRTPPATVAWYVTDDRQMYKPGEDVTLKGWLRMIDPGKNGDIGPLNGAVTGLSYRVTDAVGNEIGKGEMPVGGLGGFDTKFTLPKTPNLGYANVELTSKGSLVTTYAHQFQIQEFRRPEFEVSATASTAPFMVGGSGDITVDAKYFSGGPLAGTQVNWFLSASPTTFTPPNRDDYVFGNWQPWWGYRSWSEDEEGGGDGRGAGKRGQGVSSWSFAGKTDAMGEHVLHVDLDSVDPAMPMSVTASAGVVDVNRQVLSASTAVIVHPSSYYVGLKTKKPFVEKGKPFDLDVIGVDLEGKALAGTPIEVKAVRLDYEYKKGRYQIKEVDPQSCSVAAAKDPSPCEFKTAEGGTYQVVATIVDPQGRPNQTKLTFWVSGGNNPPAREVKQELVQLIPDKKEYAAGNTAELLVQTPFYPAEGIVTWRRSGIVKTERITMTGPTKIITVPIAEGMVPNIYVQVDLVGAAPRTDDHGDPDPKLPKRPAYAVGTIDLPVPPKQRTLTVKVTPNVPKIGPGESAKLAIDVRDASGKPVPDAEVAVIAVDEAILSLTGYQFANPLDAFYGQRGTDTTDYYLRSYVKLAKPDLSKVGDVHMRERSFRRGEAVPTEPAPMAPTATAAPDTGKAMAMDDKDEAQAITKTEVRNMPTTPDMQRNDVTGKGSEPTTTIAIRSNFNPLAAFSPAVKTGADGTASVEIKVPDNLTRYRLVAIAVAGDKQFGKGESTLTARLPLMVRPSPPRFLNFGDTFRLPVVIQNQTDAPMTVKIAVRSANATITDGAGRAVSVPPNDRVEVQFPAAAELAGTARFQIVGSAGTASDAAEISLPVWTPATTEAFATYGVIDNGAVKQPVALPGKVVTQFGGLEVTTASTNLQALTDALLYLVHYPFECAEQRSSRVVAIAALRDVLAAFKTKEMPTAAEMEHSVETDLEHLSQMQNYDGGFAFWDRGYQSEPYLTVFVTNALVHAKAKGFTVPQQILDRAQNYLRNIESYYPWYYPPEVRWAISSYALYTRKQMGDLDIAKGQQLLRDAGGVEKVTIETDGWLLGLFAQNPKAVEERKAIMRYALNHVSETAGAANFTTSYGDGNYLLLSSDRRVDGVMLESLIQEQKDLDVIPKIVTGLLAHRTAGRWLDTQENSFILRALDLYFHTYEKTTPDFVARVWLGNDYAGDHTFKGRTTENHQIDIPMKDVATHDKADLTIQKDGAGRLYYRVGMRYAPASLKLESADYGFVVERRYEGVDDPKDVTRDKDGTWHIKAGTRVRIKLTMVNENRRYHVALVDPMPAGLEAMNPALAVTGPIPADPNEQKSRGAYWWWYGTWYEHQNMRDERVEAFASLLWEGVHSYD